MPGSIIGYDETGAPIYSAIPDSAFGPSVSGPAPAVLGLQYPVGAPSSAPAPARSVSPVLVLGVVAAALWFLHKRGV